jgi:iron transport multicopper oxidase
MGLATLGDRVIVTTGNGQGHANGNIPASGRIKMSTLDECVASFTVSATGVLSLSDYFQPYNYIDLDAADQDLGSSGTSVLDGSVFRGGGVNRVGLAVGKPGKMYVLNMDNLGGFKQAPAGSATPDAVLQTIQLSGSVYGGVGSYPLEGGYIYVTPVGGNTSAFKLGFNSDGTPTFSLAGVSKWTASGRWGVGQMTITSNNGQPGSAIVSEPRDVISYILSYSLAPCIY